MKRVPISKQSPAHATQPSTATSMSATNVAGLTEPSRPIAAAAPESSTIASAWAVALRSRSTSANTAGSRRAAPSARRQKSFIGVARVVRS